MSEFEGKVALITGASSGIGKETAIHFASLGCRISITGRKAENLEYTKQECIVNGTKEENIFTLVGDVTNEEFAKQLIEETVNYFGRIDILVNCAGIGAVGTTENLSLQLYDEVMNVNCRSVFMLTQMAIPHLKKTRGNIINVSSVAGLRTFAGIVAYTMSKAALDQMTRTAALELAADGIRVNSVNPAVIITEFHKRAGMSEEEYTKFLESSKTSHPLGRVGTVDEVAKTISFLASEDASFITGVTLPIDGGKSQMCPR